MHLVFTPALSHPRFHACRRTPGAGLVAVSRKTLQTLSLVTLHTDKTGGVSAPTRPYINTFGFLAPRHPRDRFLALALPLPRWRFFR